MTHPLSGCIKWWFPLLAVFPLWNIVENTGFQETEFKESFLKNLKLFLLRRKHDVMDPVPRSKARVTPMDFNWHYYALGARMKSDCKISSFMVGTWHARPLVQGMFRIQKAESRQCLGKLTCIQKEWPGALTLFFFLVNLGPHTPYTDSFSICIIISLTERMLDQFCDKFPHSRGKGWTQKRRKAI